MIRLFNHSEDVARGVDTRFERFVINEINPGPGLTGITGSKAAGRTGVLLHLMKKAALRDKKVLYLDLTDPWFTQNSLESIIKEFDRTGGEDLFVNNIQRYLSGNMTS